MYYMHEIRLSKMFRVQVIHLANCWICFQFISLDTDIRHVKSNKLSPPEDILNHDLREKRNLSLMYSEGTVLYQVSWKFRQALK